MILLNVRLLSSDLPKWPKHLGQGVDQDHRFLTPETRRRGCELGTLVLSMLDKPEILRKLGIDIYVAATANRLPSTPNVTVHLVTTQLVAAREST